MMTMPQLTAASLQDDLLAEVERLLGGIRLPSPAGERMPVQCFPDDLPIPQSDDDPDPFPYAIVRLSSGAREAPDEAETVTVNLLFGCYDNGADRQGHRDILNLIELVKFRFLRDPLLGPYEQTGRIEWVKPEDDPYPYYFGGMQLTFAVPTPRREHELT